MKLNVKAFALTCGLVWGFGLLLITWWIILMDGSSERVTFISQVYRGYAITPTGSLFGLAWGFGDGIIGGAIFAWIYNLIAGRGAKSRPA